MAYNKFTLEKFIEEFKLKTAFWDNPTEGVKPSPPSAWLTETLKESRPLGRSSATEKARSEFIVAPILLELRRIADHRINIFSGKTFDVAPLLGLKGACDFIITRNPDAFILREPIVAVVEAKKGDLDEGIGQCAAEMFAAQLFNQQRNESMPMAYGAVTTGETWKFLKLDDQTLFIQPDFIALDNLDKILGLLLKISLSGMNDE